jgi:hypothetical protein
VIAMHDHPDDLDDYETDDDAPLTAGWLPGEREAFRTAIAERDRQIAIERAAATIARQTAPAAGSDKQPPRPALNRDFGERQQVRARHD